MKTFIDDIKSKDQYEKDIKQSTGKGMCLLP